MMKSRSPLEVSRWRSEAAAQRFRSLEDTLWLEEFGGVPPHVDVSSDFGTNRVYRLSADGPNVVLLHGIGGTAVQWARLLPDLAGCNVYAVDTIGDVGRMTQTAPITDDDDLVEWLTATLDSLGVSSAFILGNNSSCTIAMGMARRHPQRVRGLVLCDPAGFEELGPKAVVRVALSVPTVALPTFVNRAIARKLGQPTLVDRRLARAALGASRHFSIRLPRPRPIDDSDVAAIAAPALVLLGGESALFNAQKVRDRIKACNDNVEAELVDGYAYALINDRNGPAGPRIRRFLDEHAQ